MEPRLKKTTVPGLSRGIVCVLIHSEPEKTWQFIFE